jgi:transcriptional regulator of acetoin/glycerol metabolism
MALQARLLRVIEEREVTPLGAETTIKVDFQLISASHRNLLDLVQRGLFREDLYYRLNGIEINLPPLCERADLLPLVQHILESESDDPPDLSAEARQALVNYAWPGNIRQLRHVLQMAIALCDGPEIRCAHLPAEILDEAGGGMRGAGARAAPGQPYASSFAQPSRAAAMPSDDEADLSALNAIQIKERETVLAMLDEHRWNVSNVAKTLGISRNTLYRKMHRLHIRLSHDASQASADDAFAGPADK